MRRLVANNSLLIVYVFLVIYTPPIGPNHLLTKYLILLGGPILLTIHYLSVKNSEIGQIFKYRPFIILIFGSVLGSLYFAVVKVFTGNVINSFADTRIFQNNLVILMLFNCAFIIDMLARRGFSRKQAFDLLLIFGSAQGIFAALGAIFPTFKSISNGLYLATGGDNPFVLANRIYGFSTDFTYGTQIYHGALAGIAVYFSIHYGNKYWIAVMLLLLTVVLNGRTGLIVFLLISIFSLVFENLKQGRILALFGGLLGILSGGLLILAVLKRLLPASYEHILAAVRDTVTLFEENEASGNLSSLSQQIKMIPDGLGLVFGQGLYIFTDTNDLRTDIGITIDLFAGGLVLLALVYVPFLIFVWKVADMPITIKVSLTVTWLVSNFKGEFFRSSILLFIVTYVALLYVHPMVEKKSDLMNSVRFSGIEQSRL